jgi:acyl-CoA reductase-like NAD-dependent aldehyde dehydrogenase
MEAVERMEAHIADAVKKGAKMAVGGTRRHLLRADRLD